MPTEFLFYAIVGPIAIVAMFLLLIGPHEFGHFIFAKLFKVRVFEFALGMGSQVVARTRGGTQYTLRALPVGGYVRLAGMEPGTYDDPDGFHSKPAWQRLLVLLAGPGVNFLMAALMVTGLALSQVSDDPGKVIGIFTDTPAYSQGIRPGDHILSINGMAVKSQGDIRRQVDQANGQPVAIVLRKSDGKVVTLSLTPAFNAQAHRSVIGVATEQPFSISDALYAGAAFPWKTITGIVAGIGAVASGQIPGGLLGPSGATGAIGIGYITLSAARSGFPEWLYLVSVLSVALGLANLLPLPALDGGRIVVVLLEKLRGKPFDREREMQVQRFGLVAMLALVAFIAYFDIQRIVNHQFPGLH